MMSYFIVIGVVLRVLLPAWLMDRLFGDPVSLPHPVIWFGKMIAFGEKRLNKGSYKLWKGGIMSVLLILFVYSRSEERRVGKECRSRWSPYH